jgi:lipocalin
MIGLLSALLAITFVSAAPTESVSAEPSTESLFPLCSNPTSRTDSCKLIDPKIYVEHPWYEQGRSWMIRNTFERHSACVTASYSFKPDGINIKILNMAINEDDKNNTVESVEGNDKKMKTK